MSENPKCLFSITVVLCPIWRDEYIGAVLATEAEGLIYSEELHTVCEDGKHGYHGDEVRVCQWNGTFSGTPLTCYADRKFSNGWKEDLFFNFYSGT